MRRGILLACALFALEAAAQSGYYERLQYRSDDPFVFCTEGQGWKKAPMQCWIPLPPYTGNYTMMAYCAPPTYPYGKQWTQDDWNSLRQYLTVCPQAQTSGAWEGNGQPASTPVDH